MSLKHDKKCFEILADAVNRTVGTGFVHAAIMKAANSQTKHDRDQAGRAFRLLSARETRQVRSQALEEAEFFRDHGEIPDPMMDFASNPAYGDIRHKSTKLGHV